MRCGVPAVCVVQKTFRVWLRSVRHDYPVTWSWDIRRFFDFLTLLWMLLVPLSRTVPVPLCSRHRGHWRRYRWLVFTYALLFLSLLAGLVWWLTETRGSLLDADNSDSAGLLVLGILACTALIVSAAFWIKAPIYAREINDQDIVLTGVAENFPGAVRRCETRALPRS